MGIAQSVDAPGLAAPSTPTRAKAAVDVVLALLIGSAACFLYLRTLAPSVLPGDSGEFQVLARVLGNTHNTGYPIYLLLAHPFTRLPFVSVAYGVNLFSALMAAVTVVAVYGCGRLLTGRMLPALIGASALAISPTLWSQALIAEVYTTGTAFLAGTLLALLAWYTTRRSIYLFLAGLIGGLSLGVHLTVALVAPAVFVFLLISRRNTVLGWLAAILGSLLGIALYLGAFYLLDWRAPAANFIDTAIQPARSVWGLTEADLDSPEERYWFSVSGRQFQDRMFKIRILPRRILQYFTGLGVEFALPALALMGLGIAWLLSRQRALGVLFLLALAGQWIYTWTYDIWDYYVFFLTSYVLLALILTAGAGALEGIVQRTLVRRSWLQATGAVLVAIILLQLVIWPNLTPRLADVAARRVPAFPFDGYPAERFNLGGLYNRVMATVDEFPQDAIVFAEWPDLYPLYYAAHIEQGRTDLTFFEQNPYNQGGDEHSTISFIDARFDSHPIYFTECLAELRAAGYKCEIEAIGPGYYHRLGKRGP